MTFLKNLKIKDKIASVVIFLAIVFVFIQKIFFSGGETINNKEKTNITINGVNIAVDIAKTEEEKYRGLSFRDGLAKNEGMLFLHQDPYNYGYVMRNMKFDLDFIFIRDNKIVDIAKNISANYKGVIKGATKYDKVLEVPAGWAEENKIGLGDKVESIK